MELPPYLLLFLLEIRGHDGEFGYLADRFRTAPYKTALAARRMFAELYDRKFIIGTTDSQDEVAYPNGRTVHFPHGFLVAPKGEHVIRTAAARFLFWVAAISAGQLLANAVSQLLG